MTSEALKPSDGTFCLDDLNTFGTSFGTKRGASEDLPEPNSKRAAIEDVVADHTAAAKDDSRLPPAMARTVYNTLMEMAGKSLRQLSIKDLGQLRRHLNDCMDAKHDPRSIVEAYQESLDASIMEAVLDSAMKTSIQVFRTQASKGLDTSVKTTHALDANLDRYGEAYDASKAGSGRPSLLSGLADTYDYGVPSAGGKSSILGAPPGGRNANPFGGYGGLSSAPAEGSPFPKLPGGVRMPNRPPMDMMGAGSNMMGAGFNMMGAGSNIMGAGSMMGAGYSGPFGRGMGMRGMGFESPLQASMGFGPSSVGVWPAWFSPHRAHLFDPAPILRQIPGRVMALLIQGAKQGILNSDEVKALRDTIFMIVHDESGQMTNPFPYVCLLTYYLHQALAKRIFNGGCYKRLCSAAANWNIDPTEMEAAMTGNLAPFTQNSLIRACHKRQVAPPPDGGALERQRLESKLISAQSGPPRPDLMPRVGPNHRIFNMSTSRVPILRENPAEYLIDELPGVQVGYNGKHFMGKRTQKWFNAIIYRTTKKGEDLEPFLAKMREYFGKDVVDKLFWDPKTQKSIEKAKVEHTAAEEV